MHMHTDIIFNIWRIRAVLLPIKSFASKNVTCQIKCPLVIIFLNTSSRDVWDLFVKKLNVFENQLVLSS